MLIIASWLPKNCQILLFSATFKDEVKAFALQIVSQPNIIMVKKEDLNVEAIKQFFIRYGMMVVVMMVQSAWRCERW